MGRDFPVRLNLSVRVWEGLPVREELSERVSVGRDCPVREDLSGRGWRGTALYVKT